MSNADLYRTRGNTKEPNLNTASFKTCLGSKIKLVHLGCEFVTGF